MRAAWYEKQGPAREVLTVGEMPDPIPGPGEVRIRIAASGINPGDIKKRQDSFGIGMASPRVIPHDGQPATSRTHVYKATRLGAGRADNYDRIGRWAGLRRTSCSRSTRKTMELHTIVTLGRRGLSHMRWIEP
jgi:hypothetical protein